MPVDDELADELSYAAEIATTNYVLEYNGKGGGSVKKSFARAATRAGLEDVTPHTLRHTAASWLIADGVSTREVARLLGDTERMVEEVYGHHSPDYLARAAGALNSRIAAARKGVSGPMDQKRENA